MESLRSKERWNPKNHREAQQRLRICPRQRRSRFPRRAEPLEAHRGDGPGSRHLPWVSPHPARLNEPRTPPEPAGTRERRVPRSAPGARVPLRAVPGAVFPVSRTHPARAGVPYSRCPAPISPVPGSPGPGTSELRPPDHALHGRPPTPLTAAEGGKRPGAGRAEPRMRSFCGITAELWNFCGIVELRNWGLSRVTRRDLQPNPLALHRQPNNPRLFLRASSKHSWSSGSLRAVPIPWGAWAVPRTFPELQPKPPDTAPAIPWVLSLSHSRARSCPGSTSSGTEPGNAPDPKEGPNMALIISTGSKRTITYGILINKTTM
nr:uncharacterized protein LOC121470768 [Taeniopygia guttata]